MKGKMKSFLPYSNAYLSETTSRMRTNVGWDLILLIGN